MPPATNKPYVTVLFSSFSKSTKLRIAANVWIYPKKSDTTPKGIHPRRADAKSVTNVFTSILHTAAAHVNLPAPLFKKENMIKEELETIRDYLLPIQQASGKAKEPLIQEAMRYALPYTAIRYLLDPRVVTHVGKRSFEKRKDLPATKSYESIFDIIDELAAMPAVNDQMIANIHAALADTGEVKLFGYAFLCKDISLGVTAKTVNKILGYELIPEFRCMLANKYFEHPDKVEGQHFYLTEKLDGIRCIAIVREDEIKLYSRQGQPIEGLVEIEDDLAAVYMNAKECVLDGELLVSDREGIPSKEQYKRTTMIVRKDGVKTGITYNVFDVLDVDAFEHRECDMPYYLRRQKLEAYVHGLQHIKALPILYHGKDTEMITHHLNIQRGLDHEGVMINLAQEPYQFTRTNALLKVKVMQDCDLEIIGVQEGQGRFAGTLGALIVDYKGNPVGVGSGLSDEIRAMIWADPAKYIGRVATIQFFEETNDADGKKSIRFPVFRELREEGKEVSYS